MMKTRSVGSYPWCRRKVGVNTRNLQDKRFYDALHFIPMMPETSPWVLAFKQAYDGFGQAQPVLDVTDDDVPF